MLPQYSEQYLIRGVGLVKSLADIGSIVLKEVDGTPVYIRDVAEVTFGHEVRQGAVVKNGVTESVGGIVMMLRGGNAKEVVSRIKARVAEINDKGMLPDGLKIVPYYDRSELVDAALWTVIKVLLEGIALVVVVLFLFLGDVRSSLIVVATLVLTPLVTFMVMNRYHLSANLMSLGGLAIAIGLMVDGSVVVVENAFARLGDEPVVKRLQLQRAYDAYFVPAAATAAATVPVPHDRVSPTPRSCTRMSTEPLRGAVSTSTLTPCGNWAGSNSTGAATSRAASASTVRPGSTQARCGLPTSTASPLNRLPPTVANPSPSRAALPMSTVTSASTGS